MADLSFAERMQVERAFNMSSGYVLDFTNRTFEDFIHDAVARSIYDDRYSGEGASKANRLRSFFTTEPNHVVGMLIAALAAYARTITDPPSSESLAACQRIADRLKQSAPVVDHIEADTSDRTFAELAKIVRQAIEANKPEAALDRMHTFFVCFIRNACEARGVQVTRDEPVHGVLGKYLKFLKSHGYIESDMTERILKYALGTMDAFNHVRNNQSLAHANSMLNYDEALLIYSHVVAVVNFIRAVERRINCSQPEVERMPEDTDIPF